ncbi:VTT domain-containing protein [Saccharibacillus sp. CPCC 101409]|uniref:TVP38/TMEM64 family protein n=1 Tax=Saccharibacillus sp. CPCC 101409 TaxID=3058041 RepID=UPI0026714D93|nr:VTT domain-containing protein [Saccharibacillus sp. CPCC 101409]MDO3410819.1 VTT domain-containing protein [Saccharibacillus sp. CPCC 101409]
MKKGLTLALYTAALLLIFLYRHELQTLLTSVSLPAGTGFALGFLFAFFPVLPYKLVIGSLGFLYGPALGALLAWLSVTAASALQYTLVRYFFREQGRTFLNRFRGLDRAGLLMERHPFAVILAARLVPLLPQALVNLYPAFLNIRPAVYFAASALGKIPAMLAFAFIGRSLFTDLPKTLAALGVYGGFLLVVYAVYRIWLRRTAGAADIPSAIPSAAPSAEPRCAEEDGDRR